jgi:hypothetical protein
MSNSSQQQEQGDVFEVNYRRDRTYGPTDTKIGTFKENQDGDIEIEIFGVPGSGQMILRRRGAANAPENG